MAITLLYQGNTPLHLAMESAHAESAALLIEAGADRTRVCPIYLLVFRVFIEGPFVTDEYRRSDC